VGDRIGVYIRCQLESVTEFGADSMGVKLRDIIEGQILPASFGDLKGKKIAIDAYNAIYQFLAIIRQANGIPLMDSRGQITSHLSGLFYRTINLLEKGIIPIFVFDGQPPVLKFKEIQQRKQIRTEAAIQFKQALKEGDVEKARVKGQASSKLTSLMVDESKKLLEYIGIPVVQAPSEGEGQAAYLSSKGEVWATGSQDYDAILYGAHRLVRNLTTRDRRKLPGKNQWIEVKPEIIEPNKILIELDITQAQLVDIGILTGTDYNAGLPKVGPKTALKLIREHQTIEEVLKVKKVKFDYPIDEIRKIFLQPKITTEYQLERTEVHEQEVLKLLCEQHQFSVNRVQRGLDRLKESMKPDKQMTFDSF
jgi:flap endonuclease-1